ncbi:hypothetical protein [Streptomyces sp. NPDC047725]|uniref:hypothetical protein n=1 Tax=Streptomyces sp. NPDC047725 TaxID=3365487 RepID=UPI003718C89C
MSAIMFRIAHEEPDLESIPEGMLRTLITDCLVKEPAGRPTVDELLSRTTEHRPEAGAWLLGDLTARLRRQAVQLLEVEYPGRPWSCPAPAHRRASSARHRRSGTWRRPRLGTRRGRRSATTAVAHGDTPGMGTPGSRRRTALRGPRSH